MERVRILYVPDKIWKLIMPEIGQQLNRLFTNLQVSNKSEVTLHAYNKVMAVA